jgi:hypothetical protein
MQKEVGIDFVNWPGIKNWLWLWSWLYVFAPEKNFKIKIKLYM